MAYRNEKSAQLQHPFKTVVHYGNARWQPGRAGNSAQQIARANLDRGMNVCYLSPSGRSTSRVSEKFAILSDNDFSRPDRLFMILSRFGCSPANTAFVVSWATKKSREVTSWFVRRGYRCLYRHVDFFAPDTHPTYCSLTTEAICREVDLITLSHPELKSQIPEGVASTVVTNGLRRTFLEPDSSAQFDDILRGDVTLGFWGTSWGDRIDWELLTKYADRNPTYAINMITDLTDRRLPPNLKVLGLRHQRTLPCYLRQFDVALIPFRQDQNFARFANPIKALEYLSGPVPVISPPNPSLEGFSGIFFYRDWESFASVVQEARRYKFEETTRWLQDHTWAAKFHNVLVELAGAKT